MPPQYLTIKPPLGGMVESTRLEDQPAGTCSYSLNCWPSDAEQRARLSARPAIKSFATGGTSSPSTSPIRMLGEVNYATATETTRYLIASTGGNIYKLSTPTGGWEAISSDLSISTLNPVQAAPFGNKLFIADWDTPDSKTSGTGGVFGLKNRFSTSGEIKTGGTQFDDVGLDWTTVCTPDDLLVITSGNSKGVYKIAARTATELTLPTTLSDESGLRYYIIDDPATAAFVDTFVIPDNQEWDASYINNRVLSVTEGDSAGVYAITAVTNDSLTVKEFNGDALPSDQGSASTAWAIPRSSKVLDLEASTLVRWNTTDTKGVVPHGSKMIATWQDRMVLGNDQVSPHVWYMSRNGSPYDFLYGAEDLGSPVAGTNFQGGLIGEPLTALISHNKACLLMGGKDSIWVLRGDPMQGGYIERLSDDVGVLGPWAHTKSDKDVTFFLSHLGLYAMPSGCGEVPKPVGENRLPKTGPKFWRDIDQLGFDGVHNGLIVSTSAATTATPTNFWYDLGSGGWWPFSLDGATNKLKEVTALFSWQPAAGRHSTLERSHQGSLLIGCDNGKVCRFDESSSTDEGESAISSAIRIGPINFSPSPSQSSMVQEIKGIGNYGTGISSTQVLYVGATAADALSQATAGTLGYSMTWSNTFNAVIDNPRMSGHSLVLVITGDGDDWAFEEAGLTITPLGKAR